MMAKNRSDLLTLLQMMTKTPNPLLFFQCLLPILKSNQLMVPTLQRGMPMLMRKHGDGTSGLETKLSTREMRKQMQIQMHGDGTSGSEIKRSIKLTSGFSIKYHFSLSFVLF